MEIWNVVILGDGGVGKAALAVQFAFNYYVDNVYRKRFIVDGKDIFVDVLDTAAQEEDVTLREQCIREGQGFLLVYSIASRASFEHLEVQYQTMLKVKGDRAVFILVGNECEKQCQREVSTEEGAAKARGFDCTFLETSAKTAQNVERLFTDMVRMLRSNKEKTDNETRPKKAAGGKTSSDDAAVSPVEPLGSRIESVISRFFNPLRGTGEGDKKR